jgi:hypothetical protein
VDQTGVTVYTLKFGFGVLQVDPFKPSAPLFYPSVTYPTGSVPDVSGNFLMAVEFGKVRKHISASLKMGLNLAQQPRLGMAAHTGDIAVCGTAPGNILSGHLVATCAKIRAAGIDKPRAQNRQERDVKNRPYY